jgi:hypothetical protein
MKVHFSKQKRVESGHTTLLHKLNTRHPAFRRWPKIIQYDSASLLQLLCDILAQAQ